MKKMVLVTAGLLSLFIIVMKSDADMKITPSGVTSPDDFAALHLSGNFYTGRHSPNGAVISGVNSYSSLYYSYGGYFSASGGLGRGVYSKATGTSGIGVYGVASNTGSVENYGGYFRASGTEGRGVYGFASNTGSVENYGGYFKASGTAGRGVYGSAPDYGGYFETSGMVGKAVYGHASNTGSSNTYGGYFAADGINGMGVYGRADGTNGKGVYGYGRKWCFYAFGPSGSGEYGPFTGAHEVKFAEDMPGEIVPGMIVSVTGKTETRKDKDGEISLSSTLPTVTISIKARDKAVFGVIVSDGPLSEDHWYETQEGERFGVVNALGEGRVWVTDFNGQVQAGDYITTSFVQGYGQLQDDDLLHSYTLGKAIETIDWDQVTETVQQNGKTYKRYLIAVVYTSG
jgi:hypothetical protein